MYPFYMSPMDTFAWQVYWCEYDGGMKKIYVVRKYVIADSIIDAMKKEKKQEADDVWLEDNVLKYNLSIMSGEEKETGL